MSTVIPTYVYTEMTPNPASLKFVADREIIRDGAIAEFFSAAEAKDCSLLGEKLFAFPFVASVFVMNNFVTVSKTTDVDWEMVKNEVREFVQHFLMENELAVDEGFKSNVSFEEDSAEIVAVTHRITGELDQKIADILDEYVRPAVERDGGAIHFEKFEDGVVTVGLRGSCSGCPSSTVTLKNGIENLLTSMLPEVREVVAAEN